jgi:hypothetical protein
MKAGYQCLNVDWCEASHLNFTWIQDGDCYTKPPEGVSWSDANRRLKEASVSGMEFALNSWNHYYNLGKKKIEERKKSFRIGKYKIDIKPKEKGYKYPDHKQYMPSTFRWEYQIWKKSENMSGYTSIVPTHRMVSHCIRTFNSSYKSAIYNPEKNKNSIKECMDRINCTHWGTKDDRTFAKISSFSTKNYVADYSTFDYIKSRNIFNWFIHSLGLGSQRMVVDYFYLGKISFSNH